MYISRLVKTRRPHSGLLQSPSCLLLSLSALSLPLIFSPFIRLLISSLISSLYFIYLLSILVEVLLRLLTYQKGPSVAIPSVRRP
jgi:hypothetical protein